LPGRIATLNSAINRHVGPLGDALESGVAVNHYLFSMQQLCYRGEVCPSAAVTTTEWINPESLSTPARNYRFAGLQLHH
jgi:hypothetical protein